MANGKRTKRPGGALQQREIVATTTTTVTGVTDPAAPAATGGAGAVVVEKPQAELPLAEPDQPDPPPATTAPQDSLADDLRIG
ncbi:MAG: hypothetical protein M3Q73_04260, partial [bacterium]|nr:hypothetical protein [bacterium]